MTAYCNYEFTSRIITNKQEKYMKKHYPNGLQLNGINYQDCEEQLYKVNERLAKINNLDVVFRISTILR